MQHDATHCHMLMHSVGLQQLKEANTPEKESYISVQDTNERWGAGVETQKNVRGEIGGWGRVPFNETYAPSLSTIYDGA